MTHMPYQAICKLNKDSEYSLARKIILERFGNENLVRNALLRNLRDLSNLRDVSKIRQFYEELQITIHNLNEYSVDVSKDQMTFLLISEKIPTRLKEELGKQTNGFQNMTLSRLQELLSDYISNREFVKKYEHLSGKQYT